MERNWLIRTSQNQILGPITKEKLLEFLLKGALGLNDEVCSGNGYWFSIKEKDLVDKYLHGDIPQSYNPISESKSVLARGDNSQKTTSFNVPQTNATQVIKLSSAITPSVPHHHDDAEVKDLTIVSSKLSKEDPKEEIQAMKLPNKDDLEFPDMLPLPLEEVSTSHEHNQPDVVLEKPPSEVKVASKEVVAEAIASEAIVYPDGSDLDYPDLATSAPVKPLEEPVAEVEESAERDFKIAPRPVVAPVAPSIVKAKLPTIEKDDDVLTLEDRQIVAPEKVPLQVDKAIDKTIDQKEKKKEVNSEEKKLLHERKRKNSPQDNVSAENSKVRPKDPATRMMPDHLKKRNDNYLMFLLIVLVLIIIALFFYYYRTILNKPLLG